jgi:hypothetical protein
MPELPDSRGELIGRLDSSGGAEGGSSPAMPPEDPADAGLENRRVAAFVIMRSGGASAGAGSAGAGSAPGAEPNGLRRFDQPGPEDARGAGRVEANWTTRRTTPTIATSAPAAWSF